MTKKIIWLFVILLVLSGAFVGYLYFQTRTAQGLVFSIDAPVESVQIGVPFTVTAHISNTSRSVLQQARFTMTLPEDIVAIGGTNKTFISKEIGSLGAGGTTDETFDLVALGSENSVQQIRASVSYLPSSIGSRFEQAQTKSITIGESGLSVDVAAPSKIFSGSEFEAKITFKNVSQIDFNNLRLRLDYPATFVYKSASREPDADTNKWELGDLRPGSEGSFTIRGVLSGPDGAFFDFKSSLTADFFGAPYTVSERAATVAISPSPFGVLINVNNSQEYIAGLSDPLTYTILYKNNTSVALKDAIVTAKLDGAMFDLTSLEAAGSLRAKDNVIVFNASQVPGLASIPVGGSGAINFSIRTLGAYPVKRLGDKNYALKMTVQIESPTVPYAVSSDRAVGESSLETKVAGQLIAQTAGYFRDPASGILNKGTFPPSVGKPINFTIHWILKSVSTDMNNVALKAFLGPNVRFTGVAKSTTGITPTYNERTQEMSWKVDQIPAGKGVLSTPVEAIFQVEFVPGADQVGKTPDLIGETIITATDAFTGKSVSLTAGKLTTQLFDDSTLTGQNGAVRQ